MIVVCSKCQKRLGLRAPADNPEFVFTLCPACHKEFFPHEHARSLGEFLDRFDIPIAVVDKDVRVIAVNAAMSKMVGKTDREAEGLLGGEFLECKYAQLEQRCGKTIHCKACTIRGAVTKTVEAGEPQNRVPAYLDYKDRRLRFLISTRMHEETNSVILEINELY